MSKRTAISTGMLMRPLQASLERVVPSSQSKEHAFHLAELQPELAEVLEVIRGMEGGKPMDNTQAKRLLCFAQVHWPYHLQAICSILDEACIDS